MRETRTVIPSARRLMQSLRDIGYELPTAVADIVDNSIDAGASEIDITFMFDGADSWIGIADDGLGMSPARLDEAMRFGSERDYDSDELGKFGLGLKTAALSQGRRLTVATRSEETQGGPEVRRWDLDTVLENDRWEIDVIPERSISRRLRSLIKRGQGTVVLIERLDRFLRYKVPHGFAAEQSLTSRCREVEQYLAMVFHRFITGDAGRLVPLRININQNLVPPWDPYARDQPFTQTLEKRSLSLGYEGRTLQIEVQPYVLPSQAQFTTQRAWQSASGYRKWNSQQGFYVYRENRMIQCGGWNRLRTADEHTKLARIAIDIPREADAAFEINVSKMRVMIPDGLKDKLRVIVGATARVAQQAYRQKGEGAGGATPVESPGPRRPDPPINLRPGNNGLSGVPAGDTVLVSLGTVRRILSVALSDQPELIDQILSTLEADVLKGLPR